jgi:hypothetical protein
MGLTLLPQAARPLHTPRAQLLRSQFVLAALL